MVFFVVERREQIVFALGGKRFALLRLSPYYRRRPATASRDRRAGE